LKTIRKGPREKKKRRGRGEGKAQKKQKRERVENKMPGRCGPVKSGRTLKRKEEKKPELHRHKELN